MNRQIPKYCRVLIVLLAAHLIVGPTISLGAALLNGVGASVNNARGSANGVSGACQQDAETLAGGNASEVSSFLEACKKKCDDPTKKKSEELERNFQRANAGFDAADATNVPAGTGQGSAPLRNDACKAAAAGSKAAGEKVKAIDPLTKQDCNVQCDGFPQAKEKVDEFKKQCEKAREEAKAKQAEQKKNQQANNSNCKKNNEDEKKEGPPEEKKGEGKPEIPPIKPPEEKEDKKPEEPKPPQLAVPASGISLPGQGRGTPEFQKEEKPEKIEKPGPGESGHGKSGLTENRSDTTRSPFIPGVYIPAISKVDGGGGGGISSSGSNPRSLEGESAKLKSNEDSPSLDIGGGHLFKGGGKGAVFGVNSKGNEFDDLEDELSNKEDKKEKTKIESSGSSSESRPNNGFIEEQGNIFQVVHEQYMRIWKRGDL